MGEGAGVVLISPEGKNIEYALKFQFRATNNKAEYEVAIAGLQLCRALEAKHVRLRMDSHLVVNQILGEYKAREPSMQKNLAKIKSLIALFESFEVERLPRSQNEQADAQVGSASQHEMKRSVLMEVKPQTAIVTPRHFYDVINYYYYNHF